MKSRLSGYNKRVIVPIFINSENISDDGLILTDTFAELPVTETWSESMNRDGLIQGSNN